MSNNIERHTPAPSFFEQGGMGGENPTSRQTTIATSASDKKLRAGIAIKVYCRACCNGQNPQRTCGSILCPLFPKKSGKNFQENILTINDTQKQDSKNYSDKNRENESVKTIFDSLTNLQAIKEYCKICSGDISPRVCWEEKCPLYPFRLGKNTTIIRKRVSIEIKNKLLKNLQGKHHDER